MWKCKYCGNTKFLLIEETETNGIFDENGEFEAINRHQVLRNSYYECVLCGREFDEIEEIAIFEKDGKEK